MTTATRTTIELGNLSAKTRRAIKRYTLQTCVEAFRSNSVVGEGPSTIATLLGLSGVRAANAAIDAGREIETGIRPAEMDRKPTRFLYEIELHRWHPSKADQPPSSIEVMGGANDQQIAWEYARTLLRMAPNTDKSHSRVQVWRKPRRGVTEKLIWEMTRAEMDARMPTIGIALACNDVLVNLSAMPGTALVKESIALLETALGRKAAASCTGDASKAQ